MKQNFGYIVAVAGTALLLFWIGTLKFANFEAEGIKPYVENHFAMGWMYKVWSVRSVSGLIGLAEYIVGAGLVASLFKLNPKIGYYAGWGGIVIFSTTLSFLLTTPNIWHITEGLPTTDFFVVKDIVSLGVSIMVMQNNK